MALVKQKVLIPNKNSSKYFGVDYFANIYDGSHPSFKYFASSIDSLMMYKDEMVSFNPSLFEMLKIEISNLEPGKIIGFFQNPDIYQSLDSLDFLLEELDKHDLGLFIETNSPKILDDIELFSDFSKKHPLMIGIPINSLNRIDLSVFDDLTNLDAMSKIISKLRSNAINCGVIFKPLIPKVNDGTEELEKIIDKTNQISASFIYPSFTLNFDSFKIHNFYDIIDKERPELKNYYFDNFGYRLTWESENSAELKKQLVILSKKSKLLFSMKDIIALYKEDSFTQLKLF